MCVCACTTWFAWCVLQVCCVLAGGMFYVCCLCGILWNSMGVYSLHVMCVYVTVYVLCMGCICGMWCVSAM